jgi:hypothetical protein
MRITGLHRSKRQEITGGMRRLPNDGLHDLYSTPDIKIIINKSMRVGYAGNVARMVS